MKDKKKRTLHPDVTETVPAMVYKLGFKFTDEEESRMDFAIERSKQFMENYGKGRKPYKIDTRHYYTDKLID